MGEHGNASDALAGYVGTNMASGIKANWRYTKRDTVGSAADCAGTNMSMSLELFAPSVVKHVTDMSEKHADKICVKRPGSTISRSCRDNAVNHIKFMDERDSNWLRLSKVPLFAFSGSMSLITCVFPKMLNSCLTLT